MCSGRCVGLFKVKYFVWQGGSPASKPRNNWARHYMTNRAEEKVSNFYNSLGWETTDAVTEDARRWEDLRQCAAQYVRKCRLRVLRHIPSHGIYMLDMASGPIQYEEYLEYSRNYKKRYCVDLSSRALEDARSKIGAHGVFLRGSFLELPLEDDFFDCSVSLHTIYHIDKDQQEFAVRKLIKVTKVGRPVIIVYRNPENLVTDFTHSSLLRALRRFARILKIPRCDVRTINTTAESATIAPYYHAHHLDWWKRFDDLATVKILPWRSFRAKIQKKLIPNNAIGSIMFDILFKLEDLFPQFFAKNAEYPMIILTKKTYTSA